MGLAFAGPAQVSELHLVSDIWPPFTNIEPHRSFALDLVNEALSRAGVKANTELKEFDEVIKGIREGRFDGSAALWFTEDRQEFLLYSAPYLQNRLILIGRKGTDVSMSSFAELKEMRIAVVGSYAYGSEVDDASDVNFIPGRNDQENLERNPSSRDLIRG